ncbi:RNA polymerase sigma factor, partial [Candidatus Hydrogenedentota bacterium]
MALEAVMGAGGELDLVMRAKAGDRESYGKLVDAYSGAVVGVVFSRVGKFDVAQDIAQDAFLLGFENLDRLAKPEKFGWWLMGIARNLCRRWHRSEKYRLRLAEESTALRERLGYMNAPEAGDRLIREETHMLLGDALDELPLRDRESLVLYYFEGKAIDESARVLGISPVAMGKRLERARKRLREKLCRRLEDGLEEAADKSRIS